MQQGSGDVVLADIGPVWVHVAELEQLPSVAAASPRSYSLGYRLRRVLRFEATATAHLLGFTARRSRLAGGARPA